MRSTIARRLLLLAAACTIFIGAVAGPASASTITELHQFVYGGYIATNTGGVGNTYIQAHATFTLPNIDCSVAANKGSQDSYWVGMGGISAGNLVQAGVSEGCSGGTPSTLELGSFAVVEGSDGPVNLEGEQAFDLTGAHAIRLQVGDSYTVIEKWQGDGTVTHELDNNTTSKAQTLTQTCTGGCGTSSGDAEAVVEPGAHTTPDYGSVTFTDAQAKATTIDTSFHGLASPVWNSIESDGVPNGGTTPICSQPGDYTHGTDTYTVTFTGNHACGIF